MNEVLILKGWRDILIKKTCKIHRCNDVSLNRDADILIVDSGGGTRGSITSKAWVVLERNNMTTALSGYQSQGPLTIHPIVHAVTKVKLENGREVVFLMNNATLISDEKENESLCIPFDMMRHGVMVDIVPIIHGVQQCIKVEGETF